MSSAREHDRVFTRHRSNSKPAAEQSHSRKLSTITSMEDEERAGRASAYPETPSRKPLIEYCTNEWKTSSKWKGQHNNSVDGFEEGLASFLTRCIAILKAPKIRRYLLFYTAIFIFSAWLWSSTIWPHWREHRALSYSLSLQGRRDAGGRFGSNAPLVFPKLVHMKELDKKYLPKANAPRNLSLDNMTRLVFIGDVHGCLEELKALLKRVTFNPERDHLVTTGDLISRGPDSAGTVEYLRKLGASCVRGNHEDRVLLLARAADSGLLNVDSPIKHGVDNLDEESFSHADATDRALAASLSTAQIEYLESCPVILRIGTLAHLAGDLVVVHGGLVPGLDLARQDPSSVMSMRSIDLRSHVPSKQSLTPGGVHWAKLWNKYQKSLPAEWTLFPSSDAEARKAKQQHTTVIYGHDSKRGLQLSQYSKGLDTGCFRGGKLTALVYSDGGDVQTIQVPCKDYRQRRPLKVGVDDVLRDGKGEKKKGDDDRHD